MNQKGFFKISTLTLLVIIIIAVLSGSIFYFVMNKKMEGRISSEIVNIKEELKNENNNESEEITVDNKEDQTYKKDSEILNFYSEEFEISFSFDKEIGEFKKVLESNLMKNEVDRGITYKFDNPLIYLAFEKRDFDLNELNDIYRERRESALEEGDDEDELINEVNLTVVDGVNYEIGKIRELENFCDMDIVKGDRINCGIINLGLKDKAVLSEEVICEEDYVTGSTDCFFFNNLVFKTKNSAYPFGILSINLGRFDYGNNSNCDGDDFDNSCLNNAPSIYKTIKKEKEDKIKWLHEIAKSFQYSTVER